MSTSTPPPPPPQGRWTPVLTPLSDLAPLPPEPEPTSPTEATAPEEGDGARTAPGRRPQLRVVVFGAAAAVVTVAIGIAAVGVDRVLDSGSAAPVSPPPVAAPPASAVPTKSFLEGGACPNAVEGNVVRGDGPGGTDSGPAAILWFQHSYYVERSGARAWQVVAPGAPVSPPDAIQQGIDTVPANTKHCLAITAQEPGRYLVEITARRPNGATTPYRQSVTTAEGDGRTLITGIAPADQ